MENTLLKRVPTDEKTAQAENIISSLGIKVLR